MMFICIYLLISIKTVNIVKITYIHNLQTIFSVLTFIIIVIRIIDMCFM